MKLYLLDGTYELCRNHFGAPRRKGNHRLKPML
jgi:hypothetical protein